MDNFFIEIFAGIWQVLSLIFKAFSPLVVGLVLAYLLNGPSEWIRKNIFVKQDEILSMESPKGRVPSIVITYILVIVLLFIIIYAFLILILGSFPKGGLPNIVQGVYDYFNSASSDVQNFISKYIPSELSIGEGKLDPASILTDWAQKNFSLERLVNTISAFIGGIVNFFIGFVASIYLIKDKEFFLSLWQKFLSLVLKQNVHGQVNEILNEIHHVITTFIKGAIVDSLIVALLSSIVLSALNVKFAVIIGIIGGILNIIPYFGPFFGMIPAFLVAFFSNGLFNAILVVIALFLVQQLDSNYIYPKIVGDSIGLHPLFVLLSLTIFGHFGGILGMLLAVPIAGILQVLIKKWADRY